MEYQKILKNTFDIAVPLVAVALMVDGTGKEIYEIVHKFPVGSHIPEAIAGLSLFPTYFGFTRKFLKD